MTKKQTEKNKETSETSVKMITIKDQGPNLSLGIDPGTGVLNKTIELKPWRMTEEKELATLQEDHKGLNMAQYVTLVLSTMCTKLGPHDFTNMKIEEKRLHIGNMWMGDVFYAYCWLRYKSLGEDLGMNVECPYCEKEEEKFVANLGTIEVKTADNLKDLIWEHELRVPFKIRKEERKGFRFGPAKWHSMENMGDDGVDAAVAKAAIINGSIHGFLGDDKPVALSASELDEMCKIDIELITNRIDKETLGPGMSIDYKCKCRKQTVFPIKWGVDHFFGVSSR